jgi:hypothetical protein
MPDPFASIQAGERGVPIRYDESQLFKISSSDQPETNLPLPLRSLISDVSNRNAVVPSLGILPNTGSKPAERPAASPTASSTTTSNVGNPLRQIPLGVSALIDPAAEVPMIASLPAYSAVETRRIPRVDQDRQQHLEDAPKDTRAVQSNGAIAFDTIHSMEKTEFARTSKSLPVRDVDVLQSPSAVAARRAIPGMQSPALGLGTMVPAVPAEPSSEPPKSVEEQKPTIATVLPADPFAMVSSSPVLANEKAVEPKTSTLPTEIPKVPETRTIPSPSPPSRELPKSLPVVIKEKESVGFASTRKAIPKVAVSDDQPAGFARSQK